MAANSISDLEELIIRCRTDESKMYIQDAYAAYKAGAYRSCIVTTWIAIVFDLIDKIRELSISGDKKAKRILDRFERLQERIERNDPEAIRDSLNFEREILDIAKNDLELIDKQQHIDLDRLKEDRNRCAHPTFQRIESPYHPTPEQARYHIKNAISHVLQMPPVQGKQAIANLIKLVDSDYFPLNFDDALKQIQSSDFSRPTHSLINSFVDKLIHSYFDKDSKLFFHKKSIIALQCCLHMFHEQSIARLTSQFIKILNTIEDDKALLAVALIIKIPELWYEITETYQIKIREYILRCSEDDFIRIAKNDTKIEEIQTFINFRIKSLDSPHISQILKNGHSAECQSRAVELFCSSKTWTRANQVYSECISPIIDKLTREQIVRIIRSPKEERSDLSGSSGFASFVKKLYKIDKMPSAEISEELIKQGLDRHVQSLDEHHGSSEECENDEDPF